MSAIPQLLRHLNKSLFRANLSQSPTAKIAFEPSAPKVCLALCEAELRIAASFGIRVGHGWHRLEQRSCIVFT